MRLHCSTLFGWSDLHDDFDDWIPALDAQILLCVSGHAHMETAGGRTIALSDNALVGPLSGATRFVASSDYKAYGFYLRPAGFQAITQDFASYFIDRTLPLEGTSRWPAIADQVEAARASSDWASRAPALEQLLVAMLDTDFSISDRFSVIGEWMDSAASPSVKRLSTELGLSNRQAARVVASNFGFAPKLLVIRRRAQLAAQQLAVSSPPSPIDVCEGFYDQSHLIRDFQRFIGTTPNRVARGDTIARHMFLAAHDAGVSII